MTELGWDLSWANFVYNHNKLTFLTIQSYLIEGDCGWVHLNKASIRGITKTTTYSHKNSYFTSPLMSQVNCPLRPYDKLHTKQICKRNKNLLINLLDLSIPTKRLILVDKKKINTTVLFNLQMLTANLNTLNLKL